MASIDERVVVMSFENTKFEAAVAVTQATLAKLNASLANIGKVTGLQDIEKAAQKVTLEGPMSALDKLKARLGLAGQGAPEAFGSIEQSANKVSLLNPMTAIDKLRSHLGTVGVGAADSFNEIEKASNRVNLLGLNSAIDSVQSKFSALTIAASSALSTIVMDATRRGRELVSSLSLGPITGGLEEYATNLNSIQTILANTQASGAGLKDVNRALQDLNRYSDQTIYNFSQMARNIGTFTAAGVDLDTATASIKGIANLAALSGSNSEQASTAMYQLSQAISAGRVSLQDWNSVVNAGMGGTVFQRALAQTAQSMGTLSDGAVQLKGKMKNVTIEGESFRESITAKPGEKSWLTSKVLTNTLQQFTGDLSKADLAAQGFNDSQIKAIMKTAATAKNAATEVKTLKGVFDVAKESIGSGWAATFQIIFGNFEEAKKTFTDLSNAIQGVIGNAAAARNKILEGWKELGGREELIKGIKAAFEALMSILRPIHDAFRDIFPRKTAQDLFDLTVRFREFMEQLKIGPETAENLKRTFRGLFALLDIGKTIIFGIVGVIGDLLGVVGQGSGGFLAFTGSIGDLLVALDAAISKGKGLQGVFDGLSHVLETPIKLIQALGEYLQAIFGGGTSQDRLQQLNDTGAAFHELAVKLGPLGKVLESIVKIWEKFFNIAADVADALAPVLEKIADIFSHIGDAIMEGLNKVSYNDIMTFIQTTFLGGLAVGIKKLLGGIGLDLTGGALESFKSVMSTLSSTMQTIQQNVKAQTMLLIAAAMVALAGAAAVFASIDPKKLAKAMTAISVGIGQLVGGMALLTKFDASGFKLLGIATAMVILAAAIDTLAIAVTIFSKLSWEEIARGLTGVAGSLLAIGAALRTMGPSIILIGPGLIPVAIALNLIAVAMLQFGHLKWEEMAKGLLGIAGALVAIGLAVKGMGPSLLIVGPGLILVSAGLILLAGAVSSFGSLNLATIGKGLLGMAAALIVLGVAIHAIPFTMAIQAAGLLILGVALTTLAAAIGAMGSLKITTIAKGLTAIAAALLIFAVGLTAMAGTLPGSVALLAAAAAFAILTPSLVILGTLNWSTILKGLGAMAAILTTLAIVGALAAGPLTALGVALVVMGGAVLLASAGIYLLAKGFALLGDEGTKGVSVMIAAITALIALIPKMVIDFIKGIADILESLVTLAPKIATSLVSIIGTFLTAMVDLFPKAAVLIGELITLIINTINEHGGPIIEAGLGLLVNFLAGIANNIGRVTENVALIITRFFEALADKAPQIVAGGLHFLAQWLKGIADNIQKVVAQAANVVAHFLASIANELPKVYAQGVRLITKFLGAIADAIPHIIAAGVNIIVKFIRGVGDAIPRIIAAGAHVIKRFLNAIAETLPDLVDAGFKAVIKFIRGVTKAINDNNKELTDAGLDMGEAIINGILNAIEEGAKRVIGKVGGIGKDAIGKLGDIIGFGSPAKEFIILGQSMIDGLAVGATDNHGVVSKAMQGTADSVVKTASNMLSKVPEMLSGMADLDPTITPVLDLTHVRKGAKEIDDLSNVVPITAAPSFQQAAAISTEQQDVQTAQANVVGGTSFEFNQYNTSPDKLSEIEIYRQTSNQLAQAKSALGLTQ